MPSLTNPYTPGQVPRVFAGRAAELRRVEDLLARVVAFGELGGPLLVFHAPRGIGKTSLLRTAQRRAEALGFVVAWTACSRQRPVLPEIVASLRTALERADVLPSGGGWRERLDRVSVEVGIPGARVGATLATGEGGARRPDLGQAPIAALESLLHDTAALVRERGGAGLLVLLDELHTALPDDMATLLNALQYLDGARETNPLAVVGAGLPVTPEALTRAATFGERSTYVALDVLDDADARAVLTAPAADAEVRWSDAALGAVLAEAHGHPYLLQLMGSSTWDAADPQPGDLLGVADVRRGVPEARRQLQAMHRARWGSATPTEQAFLHAMAATGLDNVTRAAIAAGMGRDSRSISAPRERLIEKGVIEPVGHGLVRFTLPGFGAFVRALDD
ncbi:ATP-binding protein [Nocardioides sp.]|uniref:ATP-binding protein n=1 Tax=Nocardioides sp. TaxID=35761 RepID=UPI0035132F18